MKTLKLLLALSFAAGLLIDPVNAAAARDYEKKRVAPHDLTQRTLEKRRRFKVGFLLTNENGCCYFGNFGEKVEDESGSDAESDSLSDDEDNARDEVVIAPPMLPVIAALLPVPLPPRVVQQAAAADVLMEAAAPPRAHVSHWRQRLFVFGDLGSGDF